MKTIDISSVRDANSARVKEQLEWAIEFVNENGADSIAICIGTQNGDSMTRWQCGHSILTLLGGLLILTLRVWKNGVEE